jgi:hypothetical protein
MLRITGIHALLKHTYYCSTVAGITRTVTGTDARIITATAASTLTCSISIFSNSTVAYGTTTVTSSVPRNTA